MRRQSLLLGHPVLAALLAAAVALAAPAVVGAHHGWGGYYDEHFELTGTVETPVSLAGPHAALRVKAADGKVWDVVLAPSTRTERAGLKEGIIPAGAQVTVRGHRHRDANKLEVKTERLSWNNRVFDVYPDRD